jgi:hypothetical protein
MVTATAQTHLSFSVEDAWTALGRRATYLCFPGVTAGNETPHGTLHHALDLPIVDGQEQTATLTVSRAGKNGRRERCFAMRGPLVTIAGHWRLEPGPDGVRVQLTLEYEVAPPLKTLAVDTLRSRSPLPIRTDADAILSRAVDEFFETRFTEQAAAYCERLRERLEVARPPRTRRA